VVSLFAWVTYLLASKRVRRKVETVRLLACSSVVGGVTVSLIALVIGADVGQMNGQRWMWISLLALVPGLLGHGVFSWAQPRVDASVSSVLIQAEPVIASFAAWGILGQRVSLVQMLSMGVVVAALGALAWSESRDSGPMVLPEDDPRV
jgi:drug/metabolite transporter (DMT)-like permease